MRISTKSVVICLTGLAAVGTAFWYQRARPGFAHRAAALKQVRSWEGERFDQPQEAQNFFIQKRVPGGTGPLDYSRYAVAMNQVRQNQQYSIATGTILPPGNLPVGNWTFLGPGNVGGRTRAIIIDPTNTQVIYSAAVAGGVWKTTNGGGSWSASSDFLADIAVNSLVMDPNNHLTLYAGTGEGYFNVDGQRGNGIYKTTDGGNTWTQLAFTNNNSDFYYVNKLTLNAPSSRLYAATRTGIFRSLDGGNTWTKSLDATAIHGCMDVKVQTDRPLARVFAACGTFTNPGAIYRAIDNSGTQVWTSVWSPTNMGRTSLALAPSNQSTIYALTASNATTGNYQQGLLAIYRSVDSGTTWTTQVSNTNSTTLNTLQLTNPIEANLTYCGFGTSTFAFTQGWYDNILAVDPTNPNTVWTGGIDLFRSTDGGQNWGVASYWWVNPDAEYSHADHHALVFDPNYNGGSNQILYDGNDGGIFMTSNAALGNVGLQTNVCGPYGTNGGSYATNPVTWTNLNNSYGVTQFYYGVPFPNGTTYFGGTQDNGTPQGTDGGGINGWVSDIGGDGGAVAVNPANTLMAFGENTGLSIQRTTDGWVSTDASFTSGITESSGNFLFITPFAQDPGNAANMWTGGAYIWRTTQATANPTVGNIWTRASAFLAEQVASIAVAPTNSNTVYVGGASSGKVYYNTSALTATSTTTWSSGTPQANCYISGLAVDPVNSTTAWAVSSTFGCTPHVWQTTNGGLTWSPMGGTGSNVIPDIPAHTIAINPSNGQKLYLGTDLGVFVSVDGGNNWLVENNFQLPNVIVDSLVFNTSGTIQLFAFTHGRGAWKVTPN